jgi:N-formylglutamate deformylase
VADTAATDDFGVELLAPTGPTVGILASIPHGGRTLPSPFDGQLAVDPMSLWSDWCTRELYEFLPALGIPVVRTSLSRFVADTNRDPETGHGTFWTSVVPATDWEGNLLYRRPLAEAEVADRIATAHTPFHRLLDQAVHELLTRHDRVLVLDLHSFGMDLGIDVDLGDRHGVSAAPGVIAAVQRAFETDGLTVGHNQRFRGGWIVKRVGQVPRVDAVQVELNQRVYLDPTEADDPASVPAPQPEVLAAVSNRLERVVAGLIETRAVG